MIRHVIAASALLLATSLGTAAAPVPTSSIASALESPVLEVKRGGHGHGRGWGHHRGRHYGWTRGRHRGWYKHHRGHRAWHGHRRYRW
jgi:hypothetical protein